MANIALSFTNETVQYPPNFYQYYQGDTVNLTITPTDIAVGETITVDWTGGAASYVDGIISENYVYDGNPIVINKQLADTNTAATKYTQVVVNEANSGVQVSSYILIISNIITFSWQYIDATTYMPLPADTEVTEGMMIGVRVTSTGIPLYQDMTFTITGDVSQDDYTIRWNVNHVDAGSGTIYFTFNEDTLVEGDENFIFQLNGYESIPNSSFTIPVIDTTPAPVVEAAVQAVTSRPAVSAGSNQMYFLSANEVSRYLTNPFPLPEFTPFISFTAENYDPNTLTVTETSPEANTLTHTTTGNGVYLYTDVDGSEGIWVAKYQSLYSTTIQSRQLAGVQFHFVYRENSRNTVYHWLMRTQDNSVNGNHLHIHDPIPSAYWNPSFGPKGYITPVGYDLTAADTPILERRVESYFWEWSTGNLYYMLNGEIRGLVNIPQVTSIMDEIYIGSQTDYDINGIGALYFEVVATQDQSFDNFQQIHKHLKHKWGV